MLVSTDMLTQLANRQSFVNTVESLISDEQAEPFTLVYLDLDRFKLLNDTYGHDFFGKEEADYYRRCDIEVVENQRIIDIPSEVVTTKAGKIIAHTIKVPTKLPDGRLLLLGILEDITQLHEAKKQIEHYQKHLEELV